MKLNKLFVAAAFIGMFTGLALAHHSTAGYDMKTTSTLKGTVAQWLWRNPHCILVWDVKDQSGKVTRWSGEMQSPISNAGFGLTRDTFKPGDELIVTAHPGPNAQALVLTISDAQGKMILNRYEDENSPGARAERAERNAK